MKLKIFFIFIFCFYFLSIIFNTSIFANDDEFITIVNPVRISYYTKNSSENIRSEYSIVKNASLPATWLLTYEILLNKSSIDILKSMNKNQEIGIFLEITPQFAQASGVKYHDSGNWHYANSVFLSGYTQEERIKLIDTIFDKFKKIFTYYPSSMGSWWTDSFSLSYMKEKYDITGNLGVADQFATDDYQVWGAYWSTPFYPSKYHAGVPATNLDTKIDIVTIQWAPMDPLNGYYSSLYSTQDYHTKNLGIDYFEKLINLYGRKHNNNFGQVTVGLEGDLTPEAYKNNFSSQVKLIKKLTSEGFRVTNIREFSDWYRKKFPELSPPYLIESDDFLGTNKKVKWYQSPRYRIGLVQDGEDTKIIDFRSYHKDLKEPYFESPNRDLNLSINTPSYFDEISNPEDIWPQDADTQIQFNPEKFVVKGKKVRVPEILSKSLALGIVKNKDSIEIIPKDEWISPRDGIVYEDYSAEAKHFFKQKKAIFSLLRGIGWNYFKKENYLIPQGEIDALYKLSVLPKGKVMVSDNECLQCEFHTKYKPPAFSNARGYIKDYGKHPIIYNSSVFKAKTREEAKKDFDKLGVKYLYVVKFEEYIEKVPFSPGDLGIEKIFSNANAEIWRVKNL